MCIFVNIFSDWCVRFWKSSITFTVKFSCVYKMCARSRFGKDRIRYRSTYSLLYSIDNASTLLQSIEEHLRNLVVIRLFHWGFFLLLVSWKHFFLVQIRCEVRVEVGMWSKRQEREEKNSTKEEIKIYHLPSSPSTSLPLHLLRTPAIPEKNLHGSAERERVIIWCINNYDIPRSRHVALFFLFYFKPQN